MFLWNPYCTSIIPTPNYKPGHGGTRRAELKHVPLEDCFEVVGTSIAYDFNLQKEAQSNRQRRRF